MYPVGKPRVTPNYIEEAIDFVSQVHPERRKSEEIERLREHLTGRIENKDYRTFSVYFKSGSFRVISPRTELKLALDFDKELGLLSTITYERDREVIETISKG